MYVQREDVGIPYKWAPAPGRLAAEKWEEILLGRARGESMSVIARGLARAPPTITKEGSRPRRSSLLWGRERPLPGRESVEVTRARQACIPVSSAR